MTSRREVDADIAALTSWILDRVSAFSPLDIVDADVTTDVDPDGNGILVVTLHLNPPADDGPWSVPALLKFHEAVTDWVHDAGYVLGPHVHLRDARLAEAG